MAGGPCCAAIENKAGGCIGARYPACEYCQGSSENAVGLIADHHRDQSIDPNTGPVFADPTQIHQIIMNLCTNAFHAMEHTGGQLDILLKETTLNASDLVEGACY
jgi:signal transduction histidine kinase